jgi:hypothetical protein
LITPGVRHVDIKCAKTPADVFCKVVMMAPARYVADDANGSIANILGCLIDDILPSPCNDDLSAFLSEEHGSRFADATIAAGNDSDLIFETRHFRSPC